MENNWKISSQTIVERLLFHFFVKRQAKPFRRVFYASILLFRPERDTRAVNIYIYDLVISFLLIKENKQKKTFFLYTGGSAPRPPLLGGGPPKTPLHISFLEKS